VVTSRRSRRRPEPEVAPRSEERRVAVRESEARTRRPAARRVATREARDRPEGRRVAAAGARGRTGFRGLSRPVAELGKLRKRPADVRATEWNQKGEQLIQAGRYREAEAVLRRGIAQRPNNPTYGYLLYNLGCSLLGQGDEAEAKISFRRATAHLPDSRRANTRIAAALRHFRRAPGADAARDEEAPEGREEEGGTRRDRRRGVEEAAVGEVSIPARASARSLNTRGHRLLRQRKYGTAELYLRAALSRKPSTQVKAWTLYNLGWSLQGQGRYEEARNALARSASLQRERPEPYRRLAQVYRALGDRKRAERALVQARRLVEE